MGTGKNIVVFNILLFFKLKSYKMENIFLEGKQGQTLYKFGVR